MKFISSRELRINPGAVWKLLHQEKDLIITSNGKPLGVLTVAEEEDLEDVLATLRRGRAQAAVARMRQAALGQGLDKLSDEAIEGIIRKARRSGRKAVAGAKH